MPDVHYHEPVLLNEAVEYLFTDHDHTHSGIYVDCTLGGGGYSKRILEHSPSSKVIAFDRDINAIEYSKKILNDFSDRIKFVNENFAEIKNVLSDLNISFVAGLIMDLGLSTYQLEHEAGFSYQKDTELDMRSDRTLMMKAKDVLNNYSLEELIRIFREYGELRYYKQIARDIVSYRNDVKKFETTSELYDQLSTKIPPRYINSDMSKIFQALRIEVNSELENLKKVISDGTDLLEMNGMMVCVSYHSLEDRIVKNMFRKDLQVITKKPVLPAESEISLNKRARSAKLRAAQKK